MERKYGALQTVSVIYRAVAVLILVGAVILGGLTMITPSLSYDYATKRLSQGPPLVLPGIGIIIGGLLLAVSTFAFGQLIDLLIDLELNTRRTANLLQSARTPSRDAPQLKKLRPDGAP